ncbi:NERD domain-containing protein [Prescottella equi]|uniref:NERD domain-containing protein n=1 Tax=Rhodococcus hoagii TaxID=43767 RepID=UPI00301C757A
MEVSKSAFAYETEGLNFLREIGTNTSPYRAWTDWEITDNEGFRHEFDELVLGRRRLHLIELKRFVDQLGGTETNWVRRLPSVRARDAAQLRERSSVANMTNAFSTTKGLGARA